MAVSGNQLTRIGASLNGVAQKLTILAKSVGDEIAPDNAIVQSMVNPMVNPMVKSIV